MAKLNTTDLEFIMSEKPYDDLATDKADAMSIEGAVDSFISGSISQLQGDSWDMERKKMDTYKTALGNRVGAASILHDAIVSALNKLKTAMGKYDELDSSKLEEYRTLKETKITERDGLSLKKTVYSINSQKKIVSTEVPDEDNIAKYNELDNEINELTDLIDAIVEFEKVYNEVEQELADAFSKAKTMCSSFTTIQPSSKITFSPTIN